MGIATYDYTDEEDFVSTHAAESVASELGGGLSTPMSLGQRKPAAAVQWSGAVLILQACRCGVG